jgi:hypothetical protein
VSSTRRHCEERSDEAIQLAACGAMDCFAALAMTGRGRALALTPRDYGNRVDAGRNRQNFFIIFVDAIFTTLFEPLFTNVFDVMAQTSAFACLYRAGNAD